MSEAAAVETQASNAGGTAGANANYGNATPGSQSTAASLADGNTETTRQNGDAGSSQAGQQGQAAAPGSTEQNGTGQADPSSMDWRHRMAQGLKEEDRDAFINEASRSDSETSFAQRFLDLRRSQSKMMPVPDPDNDDAKSEIWNKLGRPEKPDAYEFKAPEGIEVTDSDKAAFDDFKPIAHRHGVTQKAMDEFVEAQARYNKLEAEARQVRANDLESERRTQLKAAWGGDFEQNLAVYSNVVTHTLGGPESTEREEFRNMRLEDGTLVSNHPTIVRMLTKLGRERVDDDTDWNPINQDRKVGAQERLKALQNEMLEKRLSPGMPGYPQEEFARLYKEVGSTRRRTPNDRFQRAV